MNDYKPVDEREIVDAIAIGGVADRRAIADRIGVRLHQLTYPLRRLSARGILDCGQICGSHGNRYVWALPGDLPPNATRVRDGVAPRRPAYRAPVALPSMPIEQVYAGALDMTRAECATLRREIRERRERLTVVYEGQLALESLKHDWHSHWLTATEGPSGLWRSA